MIESWLGNTDSLIWLFVLVVVSTFMLEDLAIIGAGLLAASGRMAPELAFAAVCLGMYIGDTALYLLGRWAYKWPWLNKYCQHPLIARQVAPLQQAPIYQLALIRCMPGLRTFGYIACGVARVPFGMFNAANILSIVLWAAGIFTVAYWLGQAYAEQLNEWLWWLLPIALVLFVLGQRKLRAKIESGPELN